MEKWKVYAMIALVVLLVVFFVGSLVFGYLWYQTSRDLSQANLIIDTKQEEIQEFDSRLNISKSALKNQSDLADEYRDQVTRLQNKLQKKTDKINTQDLQIKSRDETIAALNRKISGGKTTVTVVEKGEDKPSNQGKFETVVEVGEVCGDKALAYTWQDNENRFKLTDPNIFEPNNETFTYKQYIKITGIVLSDESGNVQVKEVRAVEVVKFADKEGQDPEFRPVKDGELVLIDSKFEYTNKEEDDKSLLDVITLRPYASFDSAITPGFGLEVINLGRYIDYANFGIGPKVAFDVSDPLGGSLQNSRVGISLMYHLAPPLVPTNFAVGASVSTPFNNLGQPVFTVDLILYLTDDLSPLRWFK